MPPTRANVAALRRHALRSPTAPPKMGPRPRAQAARAAAPDRRALDPTRSGPVRSAATPPVRDPVTAIGSTLEVGL